MKKILEVALVMVFGAIVLISSIVGIYYLPSIPYSVAPYIFLGIIAIPCLCVISYMVGATLLGYRPR